MQLHQPRARKPLLLLVVLTARRVRGSMCPTCLAARASTRRTTCLSVLCGYGHILVSLCLPCSFCFCLRFLCARHSVSDNAMFSDTGRQPQAADGGPCGACLEIGASSCDAVQPLCGLRPAGHRRMLLSLSLLFLFVFSAACVEFVFETIAFVS